MRLLGEQFKTNGRPKLALTREKALERAQKDQMHAYRCRFCGEWHLAKSKRKRKAAKLI